MCILQDPTFAELKASLVELMHKHGGWALFVTFASFILLIQSAVVLSQFRFALAAESKFAVAYAVITMVSHKQSLTFWLHLQIKTNT